jgi:hypothetical protein
MLSYLVGSGALLSTEGSALASPAADEHVGVLQRLLQRNHGLRPEYGPGYSNHVSMGLFALTALGGSARQLTAFADASWSPLEPVPKEAGPAVTRESFPSLLGQRTALNGYRRLFTQEVSQLGRTATLERYLPRLLPGLGAAAFHPLIRTGYGVRFGDDQEVADGLAYWATAYLPLGELGAAGAEPAPSVLLSQLRAARTGKSDDAEAGLILERMRNASHVPQFAPTVAALQPREDTLRRLASVALELYTVTGGNFIALHAVTGTHALRMLWPHLPQKELAARYLWQALVAAYLTVGTPALSSAAPSSAGRGLASTPRPAAPGHVPDWSQIVAKAVGSTDPHDLKLVDVAREESTFYQEPGYRQAAALRLRLI